MRLVPSSTSAAWRKSHIGTLVCHTNDKVSSGSLDTPPLTWRSLHDDTQDSKTIEENIKHLDTFAVKTLQEIVETEREMFGSTSLEVFARVDLGLILNKEKGRYEWMVNEVERLGNASLWLLNSENIHDGSHIPKEIATNLSDYLRSPAMARTRQRLYASQARCWWKIPTIY